MIKAFLELWYLWLLILVGFVYRLYKAKIKGIIGERTISAFLTRLDPTKYKVINDLLAEVVEMCGSVNADPLLRCKFQ